MLQVTWDLSFLTRDQTRVPCSGSSRVLIAGPPGNSQVRVFIFSFYLFKKFFSFVLWLCWVLVAPRRISDLPWGMRNLFSGDMWDL